MITSLVLGVCGTLLALLGLKCTQLGFSDKRTKGRISIMSGMIFALAGKKSYNRHLCRDSFVKLCRNILIYSCLVPWETLSFVSSKGWDESEESEEKNT